ncbi:MAG: DUF4058 domain-containing protein [Gemmataceae bacterium]|nr:DUF4058 domain-containing protein [Gemmataceae bacterium]
MPLLDHFRPPLGNRLGGWHSFHNSWATYISAQINDRLPAGYYAAANLLHGIEVDVAAFADDPPAPADAGWTPPPPQASSPLALSGGVVEIGIFSQSGGPTLAGAVELVSPSNKDRPATRDAFVSKCAAYVQAGVGLVVVDVVTEYTADLHAELLARLGTSVPGAGRLFAAAYRPVERDGASVLDRWHEPLAVGGDLPTLPLWLRGGLCVPVELRATYDRTCREQRVTPAA